MFALRSNKEEETRYQNKKSTARTPYNYNRLREIIACLVFDAAGNWLVHEKCCRGAIEFSATWMESTHIAAVSLRLKPTEMFPVSKLNAMPNVARSRTLTRIIRPADCTPSVEKYVRSLEYTESVKTVKEVRKLHELTGKASYAAKKQ